MSIELWTSDPETAYLQWQRAEATGADRRAFAEQSIVQHCSMFARFHRYLMAHRATVATFGADHIDGFFSGLEHDCQPGTTTRLRYLKLIDRMCRHLIAHELRTGNPAGQMLASERWPEDEPTPVYLSNDADARVQAVCAARHFASFKELRNTAIVALLLGSGITAAELRELTTDDLDVSSPRMSVYVKKHGPRRLCRDKDARTSKFRHDQDCLHHQRIELLGGSALNSSVFHLPFPDHVHHFDAR